MNGTGNATNLLAVLIPLGIIALGAVIALLLTLHSIRKKELQHIGESESMRLRIEQSEREKGEFVSKYNDSVQSQLRKIIDTASVSRSSVTDLHKAKEAFGQIEYFANTLLSFSEEMKEGVVSGADEKVKKKLKNRTLVGQRILLVEDNELSREIFFNILRDEGANVVLAENGKEAVEIFSASAVNNINTILMDLMMPVMDGYEASKKIRAMVRDDARTVPIIAMTGEAFFLLEEKIRECGMNGYLTKPCDIQAMLRVIMSCLWARSVRLTDELATVSTDSSIDTLTNTKNRTAYDKLIKTLDEKITEGDKPEFAIVLCDVNHLKETNDIKGHQAGDQLLRNMAQVICNSFRASPVFRVGGDEFAVLLMQDDYEHREELMDSLQERMKQAAADGNDNFASGMATYMPMIDRNVSSVYYRADAVMYENKRVMKEQM